MAYDLKRLNAELKPRYADHTMNPEILRSKEDIDDGQITFLNNRLDVLEKLGIELSEDKKAPVKNFSTSGWYLPAKILQ